MLGRTISHYRILSQLGSGGMGVVYAAEDIRLGRSVALKFVSEDLAKDRQTLDRLRREARAASALSHANICTIYDIDDDDERPFIVMELLKGATLRDLLARGPLTIRQVVDMAIQVADALANEPSLKNYHLLPSVRGDFLFRLGRLEEARATATEAEAIARGNGDIEMAEEISARARRYR